MRQGPARAAPSGTSSAYGWCTRDLSGCALDHLPRRSPRSCRRPPLSSYELPSPSVQPRPVRPLPRKRQSPRPLRFRTRRISLPPSTPPISTPYRFSLLPLTSTQHSSLSPLLSTSTHSLPAYLHLSPQLSAFTTQEWRFGWGWEWKARAGCGEFRRSSTAGSFRQKLQWILGFSRYSTRRMRRSRRLEALSRAD